MSIMPAELRDRFDLSANRVFISGTQALVRLCLMRKELDRRAGLNTAGYVTGYRGSPLGGLDQQFPKAQEQLDDASVIFEPALNEDLAATALWGTQQAEMRGEGSYDGVFGMWYGKGPGVDRSGDVFRHANLAGSSPHGGVIVLTGDDHTCESSTTSHQSEYALMDAMIPVLNPANVQEIIDFGLHAWSLSRYAGVWCGLKAVKDNIESTASIDASLDNWTSVLPAAFTLPEGGLNIRVNDPPQDQEARLHQYKTRAVQAYARANRLDQTVFSGGDNRHTGIVTTGKSYMDTLQALEELGIDSESADAMGLSLYKVAMTWPLEPDGIAEFTKGLKQIIVVEEKRGLIEDQLKAQLYNDENAPGIVGKRDENGDVLFQSEAALNPVQIAVGIGTRLARIVKNDQLTQRTNRLETMLKAEREVLTIQRKPYFCAGCPHNSSTVVPEGARAYAGIGCHWMVQLMERDTEGYTHMGGEGANWIGESRFSTRRHVYQNIGDGTFNHSGIMAIRAAFASQTNITFKILYNDAVAMTGGQTHDGGLTPYDIAAEVAAIGIKKIAFVSDNPDLIEKSELPAGATLDHRDNLQKIQKSLANVDGVTVLIYEQTCAAEKRRRRKRGTMIDPAKRVFINEAVCEGCGDCGVQSNCVAVLPLETELGRKRKIDQSACNKDFSCVNGFCPSFVTIEGGELRKPETTATSVPEAPEPDNTPSLDQPYSIAITGVGGTGVVTIGALLGMAAHLEGKGCGIIDMAGLAQKGGAVVSHIKVARHPDEIKAIRIATGGADLLLGCDLLVSTAENVVRTLDKGRSRIVVNTNETLPAEFTRNPDLGFPTNIVHRRLESAVGKESLQLVDASRLATTLMGDSIAANLFMLGVAYQSGLVPVGANSIMRAIEINGVAKQLNQQAFQWGRVWISDPALVERRFVEESATQENETSVVKLTLEQTIDHRSDILTEYQDIEYAQRYRKLVDDIQQKDTGTGKALTFSVARNAFKLMAYKDEYEVARLYTDGQFDARIRQQFTGDYKINVHLAPPILSRFDNDSGKVNKRLFGPWIFRLFRFLAPMKKYRGTKLDIFGYTTERKTERELITEYESMINHIATELTDDNYQTALELARSPEQIRGFGHVKMANTVRYQEQRARLMEQLEQPVQQASMPTCA